MPTLPPCRHCQSADTDADGALFVCPEYAREWTAAATAGDEELGKKA